MEGAVHRLQLVFRVLQPDGREHVGAVKTVVTAGLPQVEPADVRREHQLIPAAQQLLPEKVFDLLADEAPLGMPEYQARSCLILDAEQVQVLAQTPVVALPGFVQLGEVGVQVLLGEERGPVDTLQGVRALVALPVRARHTEQLEGLDARGRGNVGSAAEIQELAGAVSGEDRLGLFADELALQELAHPLEELEPLLRGKVQALVREVRLDQLPHLVLDLLQIILGEGFFAEEIVEEAGLGRRSDAGMRVGEEFEDRRRQEVRRRVAINLQPFGRGRCDELDG